MELEEKIKVLQEEFKDLPKILIKRTLCGDDVNEDLAKATDRLREFKQMKNAVPLFNNGNPANRETEETKDGLYAHPAAGRDRKANSWIEEGDTLYTVTSPASVHSTPSSLYSKQNLRPSYGDLVPSMKDDAFVRGLQAALSGRSSPSQLDSTRRHSSSPNSHPTVLAAETEYPACGIRCNNLSFASGRKILTEDMMNSTKRVNGTVAPCPPKTKPKPNRRKQRELDGDCKESRGSPPPPTPSHEQRSSDTPPQPPHAPPTPPSPPPPPPPPPLPQVHVSKSLQTSPQPPLPQGKVSRRSCASPPTPCMQPTAPISHGGLKLSSSSPFVRNCLDSKNVINDNLSGKNNDATLKVSEDTNNNVQEDRTELEEILEKLKKEFSSLPKILIKKTLCGDDVDGDITKARQRLQEFNRQFNDSAPIKNPSHFLNSSPVLRPDNNTRNHFEEQERGNRLPRNWTPMPRDDKGNDVGVHLAKLESSSAEYQDVVERFQQTVSSDVMIKSIERIQNPFLYQSYQLRKLKMDRDNEGNNERQLFHGTNSVNVTKINTQGFDRSFSGRANGALYGSGVYFARDALYSVNYTDGRCRVMYLARVLVGKYCQGKQSMRKPPPINPEQPEILFDSLVNKLDDPSIFVVYYDNQCYPEYLITIE